MSSRSFIAIRFLLSVYIVGMGTDHHIQQSYYDKVERLRTWLCANLPGYNWSKVQCSYGNAAWLRGEMASEDFRISIHLENQCRLLVKTGPLRYTESFVACVDMTRRYEHSLVDSQLFSTVDRLIAIGAKTYREHKQAEQMNDDQNGEP